MNMRNYNAVYLSKLYINNVHRPLQYLQEHLGSSSLALVEYPDKVILDTLDRLEHLDMAINIRAFTADQEIYLERIDSNQVDANYSGYVLQEANNDIDSNAFDCHYFDREYLCFGEVVTGDEDSSYIHLREKKVNPIRIPRVAITSNVEIGNHIILKQRYYYRKDNATGRALLFAVKLCGFVSRENQAPDHMEVTA